MNPVNFILGALLISGFFSTVLSLITAALFKWQARRKLEIDVPYKTLFIVQIKAIAAAILIGIITQNIANLIAYISSGKMGQTIWGFSAGMIAWHFLTAFFGHKALCSTFPKLTPNMIKKISLRMIAYSFLAIFLMGLVLGVLFGVIAKADLTHKNSETVTYKPNVNPIRDDYLGKYHKSDVNGEGTIEILLTPQREGTSSTHEIKATVVTPSGCIGDINADGVARNGSIIFSDNQGIASCVISVNFDSKSNQLFVNESNGCEDYHGAFCRFSGVYQKEITADNKAPKVMPGHSYSIARQFLKDTQKTDQYTEAVKIGRKTNMPPMFVAFIVGAIAAIGVMVIDWGKDFSKTLPQPVNISVTIQEQLGRGIIIIQLVWCFIALLIAGKISNSLLSLETIVPIICLTAPVWVYQAIRWVFQPLVMSLRTCIAGLVVIIIAVQPIKEEIDGIFGFQDDLGIALALMMFAFYGFRGLSNLQASRNVFKDDVYSIMQSLLHHQKPDDENIN